MIGTITISSETIYSKHINCHFLNLSIFEKDEGITLELEDSNYLFIKPDFYIVPTRIETFIYPFDTKIIDIECTAKNIHEQELTKKLITSPEPRIFNQSEINKVKNENPSYVNI